MTELAVVLQRFTARYRTALLANAGVVGLLGVGCSGLLAWRLGALRLPPMWAIGLPVVLAVAFTGGLGWRVRHRWFSQRAAAAHLDRVLGLQQRLITAEEFAQAPHRPALYPLLLEDAARQCAPDGVQLPRPFNHTAGMLAVMALLLLLWPRLNPMLPPFARQPEPKTQPPHQPLPPEAAQDSRQQQERQQGAPSSQQSASGAPGAGEVAQQPGGAQPPHDSSQQSGSGRDQQPSHQSAAGQQPADATQAAGHQQRPSVGNQQSEAGQQAASNQLERHAQQAAAGSRQRDPSQQRGGQNGRDAQEASAVGAGARQDNQSQPAGQSSGSQPDAGKGQGGQGRREHAASAQQQAAGDGEALKADIQELLKEVSGELKDLQAQLASATDQPKPEAGAGTDPDLYEAPMTLEDGGGDPLAIQLHSDAAPTDARRPGGGVGRPSEEVSSASPQTQAQEAQLSEQPLEEAPAPRQPVPEEYRDVFDRLQRVRR